jgi:predicted SnoaL-like aldol condensation-catalyzing enzyme
MWQQARYSRAATKKVIRLSKLINTHLFKGESFMSVENNRTLAYRVYEAINKQDVATLDTLFSPDIVRHAMREVGMEKARQALKNAFVANPETRFVVEDVIAEGDKVALRVTVHGRPTPPDQLLPLIMEIFRIENGCVAEIWGAALHMPPLDNLSGKE